MRGIADDALRPRHQDVIHDINRLKPGMTFVPPSYPVLVDDQSIKVEGPREYLTHLYVYWMPIFVSLTSVHHVLKTLEYTYGSSYEHSVR